MIAGPILIDTNVLVLYVAGSTARPIIRAHKRCSSQFSEEDYDLLLDLIGHEPDLVLLPNVVTEASNLLAQIADPHRSALLQTLRAAVLLHREICVASRSAVSRAEFRRLRLTDCALLDAADGRLHLLTVDLDLYLTFSRPGCSVTNFRHVIDGRA